jgi:hypothetical protein
LTTDPRIASGENENMQRHQRGRKQLFSPAQAPNLTVFNERFDEIVGADQAVAGTALVYVSGGRRRTWTPARRLQAPVTKPDEEANSFRADIRLSRSTPPMATVERAQIRPSATAVRPVRSAR